MNASPENERAKAALNKLIRVQDCVLSYDRSLLDQLPDILMEQYGARTREDASKNAAFAEVLGFLDRAEGRPVEIAEMPGALAGHFDVNKWATTEGHVDAGEFDHWTEVDCKQDLNGVVQLQTDLAMGRYNATKARYPTEREGELKDYLLAVTTPRGGLMERATRKSLWDRKVRWWKLTGRISPDRPSLSIGPRWLTEIRYFREILGLRRHVGLDLFSDDPELVVAGDMHAMPLPSDTYGFIFIKNTMDKSYDIRALVREIIRVCAPAGIVVIDQICGHGAASPVHRTDVQRADNLLRLFEARTPLKVLVKDDIDVRRWARDGSQNNVRLAMQIKKAQQPSD